MKWAYVIGRLHDRSVAGVVAWRNEYDCKRDAMNQAIERLVETMTTDPMNVPKVHCALPVLERVLDRKPLR